MRRANSRRKSRSRQSVRRSATQRQDPNLVRRRNVQLPPAEDRFHLIVMSIATKTGDDGTTSLMFGKRVSKTDPRVGACGACDELNAALGVARASCSDPFVTEHILVIQKELVVLMGELGVLLEDRERYREKGFTFIEAGMVDRLTQRIDELEGNHRLSFKHWATPGATRESAALDVARTVCRRAERAVVELAEGRSLANAEILRYLNRLSDLCWLYARYVETQAGVA